MLRSSPKQLRNTASGVLAVTLSTTISDALLSRTVESITPKACLDDQSNHAICQSGIAVHPDSAMCVSCRGVGSEPRRSSSSLSYSLSLTKSLETPSLTETPPPSPNGLQKQKHTTGGIPRWSPTLVLVARFSAYVWQSGRDAQFSLTYGRMYLVASVLSISRELVRE
jgi:hypothetical protein